MKTKNKPADRRRVRPPPTPRVGIATYKEDPMFPRIERAVLAILTTSKVVAPVDVLVRMDLLRPEDLEAWRLGRVPYLEKVIKGNLTRLGRLLRVLAFYSHDLNLAASPTAHMRWGAGL